MSGMRWFVVCLLLIFIGAFIGAQAPAKGTETQQLQRQILQLQQVAGQLQFRLAQCELAALDADIAKPQEPAP